MDLMPAHTPQSPEFIASVQECRAPASSSPDLLQIANPEVLRQYLTGMQTRRKDAFPISDNLIAQFFIFRELSDQQRERLISAMRLRNISLENYTYEMMKTQYHDLFITTRTSIQDPSIRPPGENRSNTFYILKQGEYEGEEGCGWKTKKDWKVSCQPRHFGYWRRTMRSLRERCLGGIQIQDEKRKRKVNNHGTPSSLVLRWVSHEMGTRQCHDGSQS